MADFPVKRFWRGKDVDLCSHDELLEIIDELYVSWKSAIAGIHSIVEINELARRKGKSNGSELFKRISGVG